MNTAAPTSVPNAASTPDLVAASPQAAKPLRIALLGNPNCGKTALFNLLTGARQKVANYAGVTVERKEGTMHTATGRSVRVLDLPGAYSLHAHSLDEAITRDIVRGQRAGEPVPDVLVCVVDATHLRLNLRLVLEARALGLPMVLVLNMMDVAERRGLTIDRAQLARELGMPVMGTVAVRGDGAQELLQWLDGAVLQELHPPPRPPTAPQHSAPQPAGTEPLGASGLEAQAAVIRTHQEVLRIMGLAVQEPAVSLQADDRIDAVVLHPVWGLLILAATLFLMFQAVFSWAAVPQGWIEEGVAGLAGFLSRHMGEGPLRSLLVDGVLAGAGGVLVFLPQILFLFLFILALEDSGYLPRVFAGPGDGLGRLVGAVVHSAAVELCLRRAGCDGHALHRRLA